MKYSNEEILKITEKAKRNKKNLAHITNKSALSTEDNMKLGFCRLFVQFINAEKVKSKDLAKMIGVSVQRMSEITNYKINKFTVDKLLKNIAILAKHDMHAREYLGLLNRVAESTNLSVSATKRLSKEVKEASVHI